LTDGQGHFGSGCPNWATHSYGTSVRQPPALNKTS